MNTQALTLPQWDQPGLRRQLTRALCTLNHWHERARQRRQLARLDAHQLRDIGISCEQALAEARRPFWE